MSEKMVEIAGNTFPVKDELKAMGGRWDANARVWRVPEQWAEAARALVVAAGPKTPAASRRRGNGLPYGELWQPCRRRSCDEEPVCVNCEYCEHHCGCGGREGGDDPRIVEPYGHGARGIIDP